MTNDNTTHFGFKQVATDEKVNLVRGVFDSVAGQYDIKVNLDGGGLNGQAEALRLGISRALLKINEAEYRPKLKAAGFLTRDPREVERKKPGRPKARKRFQFSKR